MRSYLITARNHGMRAIDAIHATPVGMPGYLHSHRVTAQTTIPVRHG